MEQQQSPTFLFETQAYELGYQTIVGLDEAGRGPLAGPVVAAACHLRNWKDISFLEGVQDSKELDSQLRRRCYETLIHHPQVVFALGVVEPAAIDAVNILQASMQAMLLAVNALEVKADYLLIDGNYFPKTRLPGLALIKGDQRSYSIAAASIIAKEARDDIMRKYHEQWPAYRFDLHKGYATKEHILAVKAYGVTPIHRLTFEPIRSLAKI